VTTSKEKEFGFMMSMMFMMFRGLVCGALGYEGAHPVYF
jgi:hypothetical protein